MASSKNNQSKKSSFRMGMFTTSKLIQNLGSKREQFEFIDYFRSIYGRDKRKIQGANIPD